MNTTAIRPPGSGVGAASGAGTAGAISRLGVPAALAVLYLAWGSTFLAIRLALQDFPPFLMVGLRFLLAGGLLYGALRARGVPAPSSREWAGATVVGALLVVGGNGGVTYAEQWVASGLAAVAIASTPLWAALFGGLFERWPSRLEWLGLGLGLAGVVLLNLGSDLRGHPAGGAALLLSAASWGFGSVLTRHLPQPPGMMAAAAQLLAGGALAWLPSLALGERLPGLPGGPALAAFAYLVVVGSLVGFSLFVYLLRRARLSLATSYAYVNPVVAMALGAGLAGERITGAAWLATAVILSGVGLIAFARERIAHR